MTPEPPPWPVTPPAYGSVVLRQFTDRDAHLGIEMGADPYIPLIGSLPAFPTEAQALDWIHRQRGRLAEGAGFSFAIADATTDVAIGTIGLWLDQLSTGRAKVGYSVAPASRGRGIGRSALTAVTTFAWTVRALHRIELYIEPWNTGSLRVAEAAGYQPEGLLRSYLEIGGTRRDVLVHSVLRPAHPATPSPAAAAAANTAAAATAAGTTS